jgi:RNA polymerase sigma factor (sigma-70 family)
MAGIQLHSMLDHLRRLQGIADSAQRSDRELLRAFVANNDQDAFATVVTRHAPLVWGVCRRILGQRQDAEDAFQATILILARRAGSIRWQSSIGGWLHTVAQRLALRARKQADQRRFCEREASRMPPNDSSLRELAAVVDQELRRLPAKYREPLLLHYLENATAEAAARQLGLSRGTFYNRLTRGRELLRGRLSRQGLSLAAPLLVAALTADAEAASRSLIETTLRNVMGTAPKRVAALATEALGVTAIAKLKIGLALSLLLGIAAGGVAMLTPSAPLAPLPQAEGPVAPPNADDKAAVRVDLHGDPLPPGAITRLGTLRFRAPDEIEWLTFAPDNKTLLVSSRGGLFLFDAFRGKRLRRIPSSSPSWRPDEFLTFSSDGKQLIGRGHKISGSFATQVVRVWETAGGHQTQEHDIGQWVLWVGWSSEGQPLALRVEDNGTLHLHELSIGRSRPFSCAKPSKYPSGAISRDPPFACSPRGHALAVADDEGTVHIWDTNTGRETRTLQPKENGVYSLTFSPDGGRLMIRTAKDVQMWDAIQGKIVYNVEAANANYGPLVFCADGKTLAIIKSWQTIRFWDAATGKERGCTQDKDDFSASFALSPDGKWLATAPRHGGGTFHLWDVSTGKKKDEPIGHLGRPHGTAFSPDSLRVATGGGLDGTFRLWDSKTGEPLVCIQQPGLTRNCSFAVDGDSLWAVWSSGGIGLYDASTGQARHVLKLEDPDRPETYQSAISMYHSDDGKRLIALSYYYPKKNGAGPSHRDTLITGWDSSTRKQLFRRRRPGMDSWIALSQDARVLAVPYPSDPRGKPDVPGQGPMRLEDVPTGEFLLTFPALEGQTWPLAFSPDGRLLAANNFNNKRRGKEGQTTEIIQLWEIATAAEVVSFPGVDNNRVAFSPDGRLLALTERAQEILVYDLACRHEQHRFKGFDAAVTWLAFSPDGRRLISGLSDSTLLIWEVGAPSMPRKLDAESAAKAWADIASKDAARAFRARGALSAAPGAALRLSTAHLHPAQAADPHFLRRLLTDLESEQFAVRDKAQKELEDLGDLAESALRQTLERKPTLEVRRRVQAVLERLRGPVTRPELLQSLRAAAVLEDIGTPEARRLLEQLAKGAPEARLTREAKASLRRLDLRSASGIRSGG